MEAGRITMFPRGRWRGWWEQESHGRQWMDPLELESDGVHLSGSGVDMVGPFVFRGLQNPDGMISLVKQYLGQHAVTYTGRAEGEGAIVGVWNISDYCHGRFALIALGEVARQMPIAEIHSPVPTGTKVSPDFAIVP